MFYLFNRYQSSRQLFTVFSEVVLMFVVALLVATLRLSLDNGYVAAYDPLFIKSWILTLTYTVSFYYFNLYMPDMYRPSRIMFMRLVTAVVVANIALFSIFYLAPSLKTWRGMLLANTILLPLVILLWRTLIAKILIIDLPKKRVLIIGSGDLAKKIGGTIYQHPDYGLGLVGFIDDDPSRLGVSIVNPGIIGGYGDIARIADTQNIDMIIVALPDRRSKLPMSALLDCKLKGVSVEEGETFNERMTGQIPLDHLKPSWMVFSDGFKSLRSRKILKRTLDLTAAAICLVISAPLMLLTAVIIKLESKGPMIFKQLRVGENGREYNIYKFRSMRADAESSSGPVWAVKKDDRVTKVGRFIRKTRIDELPQLINVLKGDMSFVGPRPERPFFVAQLKESIPYYEIRTVVKPGITGWAQIKYPYGATVQDALEKLQYDIYYIKNMSPLLDIIILFSTIKVVLTGQGAR
ncbi:MAG: TIGR03013 family PEP-CTERM/XrtA system glycosyltransferase [Deltaproteobacteria bacterium]|nr:TIGR03013 family PEP-CTERM/XrtA system glycosyltransferase [Deltaproteobacteria bacterium]